jgi:hypothetical protein
MNIRARILAELIALLVIGLVVLLIIGSRAGSGWTTSDRPVHSDACHETDCWQEVRDPCDRGAVRGCAPDPTVTAKLDQVLDTINRKCGGVGAPCPPDNRTFWLILGIAIGFLAGAILFGLDWFFPPTLPPRINPGRVVVPVPARQDATTPDRPPA